MKSLNQEYTFCEILLIYPLLSRPLNYTIDPNFGKSPLLPKPNPTSIFFHHQMQNGQQK